MRDLEDRCKKDENEKSENEAIFQEQLSQEKIKLAKDLEAYFEVSLKEVREQENKVASKLREKVESLHSEIDKLKNHHFDLESFKNEATFVNQRVMFSKVSLYTFLSSLQDIYIKLMQYEDLFGQQRG